MAQHSESQRNVKRKDSEPKYLPFEHEPQQPPVTLPDMYLEIGIGMPEVDIGKTIPGVDSLSHSPGGQRVLPAVSVHAGGCLLR